jgi:putative flippase GtrA
LSFDELTIHTIYIDDNESSHFRPLVDGWRIYRLMLGHFLRFTGSGLVSAAVDVLLFTLLVEWLFPGLFPKAAVDTRVLLATAFARVVSSLLNFTLNRRVVFRSRQRMGSTLWRYYLLAVCQMLVSAFLVALLNNWLPGWEPVLKVGADVLLFFASFRIQQRFIFS